MLERAKRLVLRYDPGQFTFSNFAITASDDQLLGLAKLLNGFQECPVYKVLKVRTFEF
ncbi:MAG: hypothetical protein FWB80_01860 [Defluviitaleaceae bacterium]|nr:hypothetical protein [Defluviitaleaceae bacterium]